LKVSDPVVRDKSLFDLQLAPASVLMFRFLEDDVHTNYAQSNLILLPEVLSQATDLPEPPPVVEPDTTASQTQPLSSTSKNDLTQKKKIPKWLKLNPKK